MLSDSTAAAPELPAPPSRLAYDVDGAAEAAGFGRNVIVNAMNTGRLPARKCGRRTVVLHEDLALWLKSLPARDPNANEGAKRAAAASVRAAQARRAALKDISGVATAA